MSSAQKIEELYLHTDQGAIWFVEPGQEAVISHLSPEKFARHPRTQTAEEVRLLGSHDNARLISELHEARCATQRPREVFIGNPKWVPTDAVEQVEYTFHCMGGQEAAASVGGWHRLDTSDYVTAKIRLEFAEAEECTQRVRKFLVGHPAWPALSFMPDLDDDAACLLLAGIGDPRWHIDPAHPDRFARLRSNLGLGKSHIPLLEQILQNPADPVRDSFVSAARVVLDTWTGGDYTPPPQDMVGPDGFLWRVYYRAARQYDGVRGMLRACHTFLRFLCSVWLDNLTGSRVFEEAVRRFPGSKGSRRSETTVRMRPCRTYSPTLFVPKHFFELPAEREAWRRHVAELPKRK